MYIIDEVVIGMRLLIVDISPSNRYKILSDIKGVKIDLTHSVADAVWFLWDEYDMIILNGILKDSLLFARAVASSHNKKAKIIIYCNDGGEKFHEILPNATIRESHE